ncbi:phospholipase A1 EG1, chloroplastic/mitochondrial-like [Curcuma longa]|uniref:phospholipase A1 EG1, chloroplastic/mitochondrial-like n=1 Tax=Curcuma longa TaxID=136217 RepID=UPI003D9E50DB
MAAVASSSSAWAVSLHVRNRRYRWRSKMPVVAVRVRSPSSVAAEAVRVRTPSAAAACGLASMWRKIQGADDWAGLVEPLNPVLRDEVVRYGELVTACYEAFDLDPASPRFLKCKHGKERLLHESGLGSAGYEITRYIYATPPEIVGGGGGGGGRWIGYVAVATDEAARRLGRRDVLVAFRGTVTKSEWAANLMSSLTPARLDPHDPRPEVKVESGFLSLYTNERGRFSHGSCREQLLKEVSRLVKQHETEEMSLTLAGHSMGSALALLLGYDLAELGLNRRSDSAVPITVYSYGGPRVGNWVFKERCEELGVKVLRVVNVRDPVTKLPGLFLNESLRRWGGAAECYAHVGVELALDFFEVKNPACVHDMAKYVALLKRQHGIFKEGAAAAGGISWAGKAAVLLRKKVEELPWRPDAALLSQVGIFVQSLGLI